MASADKRATYFSAWEEALLHRLLQTKVLDRESHTHRIIQQANQFNQKLQQQQQQTLESGQSLWHHALLHTPEADPLFFQIGANAGPAIDAISRKECAESKKEGSNEEEDCVFLREKEIPLLETLIQGNEVEHKELKGLGKRRMKMDSKIGQPQGRKKSKKVPVMVVEEKVEMLEDRKEEGRAAAPSVPILSSAVMFRLKKLAQGLQKVVAPMSQRVYGNPTLAAEALPKDVDVLLSLHGDALQVALQILKVLEWSDHVYELIHVYFVGQDHTTRVLSTFLEYTLFVKLKELHHPASRMIKGIIRSLALDHEKVLQQAVLIPLLSLSHLCVAQVEVVKFALQSIQTTPDALLSFLQSVMKNWVQKTPEKNINAEPNQRQTDVILAQLNLLRYVLDLRLPLEKEDLNIMIRWIHQMDTRALDVRKKLSQSLLVLISKSPSSVVFVHRDSLLKILKEKGEGFAAKTAIRRLDKILREKKKT